MATNWKGSIIDTYNENNGFGGPKGTDAKKAQSNETDFITNVKFGIEAVDGFNANLNPVDHSQTKFNMVNGNVSRGNFDKLNKNGGQYAPYAPGAGNVYNPKKDL